MSESRELAVIPPEDEKPKPKAEDVKAEKIDRPTDEKIIPPAEVLYVHYALLLAAEITAAKDGVQPAINGVFLHRVGQKGRIVSTDANRIFVGSFDLSSPVPSWMNSGITIGVEGLKKRVQIIKASQESPFIKLSHTKGNGFLEVSDVAGTAVFKMVAINRQFWNYEMMIGPQSFAVVTEEEEGRGVEWQPVGISSIYLKSTGEVAKILNDGLPKEKKSKMGMTIRAYNAAAESPMVFDFTAWPGAIMLILPRKEDDPKISHETQQIIAPATKGTLAALRAHATRQLVWAEEATDPDVKASHQAKAQDFVNRIAAILATQPGTSEAIAAGPPVETPVESTPEPTDQTVESSPEPKAENLGNGWDASEQRWEPMPEPDPADVFVEPAPEPTEPTPDPVVAAEAEQDEVKPTVTRTKIKVKARKQQAA